jgi:hypothetical protein
LFSQIKERLLGDEGVAATLSTMVSTEHIEHSTPNAEVASTLNVQC